MAEEQKLISVELPENWAADWELTERLGKGAYSSVYRAVRRDHPGIEAAIKVISIPASETDVDTLRSEGYTEEQSQTYYNNIAKQ